MSSLAPHGPGAHSAPRPRTGRHGTCRLVLVINECEYTVKRQRPTCKGGRVWRLRKLSGPRAGAVYTVSRAGGSNSCTCPDFTRNQFSCKHVNSLVAARLISGRKLPESKDRDLDRLARATITDQSPSLRAPGAPGARALPAPARPLPTTVPDEIRSPGARRTAAAILARAALLNGSQPKGGDQ